MSSQSPIIRLQVVCCPLCGSDESTKVITSRDLHAGIPGLFTVVRCLQCRHLFMNPQPVSEDLAACYPDSYGPHQAAPPHAQPVLEPKGAARERSGKPWYLRYLPLGRIPGLKALYLWMMDDLSQPVPAPNGSARAIETGCATGLYLQLLKEAGWTVLGVEPGAAASEKARNAGFDVITGTLDTVRLDPSSFDLAAAWMVLEHVANPRATLEHLRDALKPGGTLLLSIPNAGCWEPRFFRSWWFGWEPPRHLQHFTPVSIRRLLAETGYSDVRVIHQPNQSYVVGSLGLYLTSRFPTSRLAKALLAYPAHPTTIGKLLLAIPARLLSLLGQSGRLTVIARIRKTP